MTARLYLIALDTPQPLKPAFEGVKAPWVDGCMEIIDLKDATPELLGASLRGIKGFMARLDPTYTAPPLRQPDLPIHDDGPLPLPLQDPHGYDPDDWRREMPDEVPY